MAAKTILLSLNDTERADALMRLASKLAQRFDAHVKGVYIIPAIEIYPAGGMELSAQVYEGHRKFYQDNADSMRTRFEQAMKRDGVLFEWRKEEGTSSRIADSFITHALEADLVMISQMHSEDTSGLEPGFAEQVIMESGRPVLVVPAFGEFTDTGTRVLAAWNGTREAARAIFDSLAVIDKAGEVQLVWVNPQDDLPEDQDLPGTEMAVALARHGLEATAMAIPGKNVSTGDALLSHAADTGADLLVMGAYGHSRMREFVFGGATRTMLESMTLPVLMAH